MRRKLGTACLVIIGLGITSYYLLPLAFPVPEAINSGPGRSIILLDRDGEELGHWVRPDYYRHRATSLNDIPADLIQATLAAEDKRFYQHGGIDVLATARALRDSWEKGRFVSGASTITQQTVKLSSKKSSRTFITKARECLTSRHVEIRHEKDEILTAYFNHLDYGNLTQGPLQAARHYFNKPLGQLSLSECALLAGLPQAPSRLNPRRNPDAAIKRRNWILDRMHTLYQTPQNRIERAKSEPLQLHHGSAPNTAPHFAQLMRRASRSSARDDIHTTISAPLQRDVTEIVRTQITALSDKHIQHAAVVIIHNRTGDILTLVGSPNFHQGNSGQIDASHTPRSPGSTLKPFTYLLAFENGGMTPATIIEDIPTHFADTRGEKTFVNYNRSHNGPVTIHHALANSLNVPAIRTLNAIGGAPALHKFLTHFGISTLHENPIHYGLGLTLGSGDVTLLKLTNAYASLARMGVYKPVRFQPNKNTQEKRITSYQSTWMLARTMSNNAARSAAFGPNSSLRLPFPCAVKTGTSSDFRDNWCLGFTAEFTVGVWAGNLDNTPMRGISGITGAGPIFHATMLRLHRDTNPTWFRQPTGMLTTHIHVHTGKRLSSPTQDTVTLTLPAKHIPLPAATNDYDAKGRILLDSRYSEWLTTEADHSLFAQRTSKHSTLNTQRSKLNILSPSREARYLLDPDLPDNGRCLRLKTDFLGPHTWTSPTLTIKHENGKHTAILTPGKHALTLQTPTGRKATRRITVTNL